MRSRMSEWATLHGLCWELSGEDAEALLDSDAVSRELVVRREAGRVSRPCDDTLDGLLLERVDTLAVLSLSRETSQKNVSFLYLIS